MPPATSPVPTVRVTGCEVPAWPGLAAVAPRTLMVSVCPLTLSEIDDHSAGDSDRRKPFGCAALV